MYSITPRALEDRTVLDVEMVFRGEEDGDTIIQLPRCNYGTPEIPLAIKRLHAHNATLELQTGSTRLYRLVHGSNAEVSVLYTVDWDPAAHTNAAYRPDVSNKHFHFFDNQWRVGIADGDTVRNYAIAFEDVPADWVVFSSAGRGPGPYSVESTEEGMSCLVGGGDYTTTDVSNNGSHASIYVRGDFENTKRIIDDAQQALSLVASRFGPIGVPNYTAVVTRRGDSFMAGVAIDNAFVSFVHTKATTQQVLLLITHETLHNWIPNQATVTERERGGIDEFRFDWFAEGFVEYCARRVLFDAGILTEAEYCDTFNGDLREYARNPMRSASIEMVQRSIENTSYSNYQERLSYFRGPLLAQLWDRNQQLTNGTPVVDIVANFVEQCRANGGSISADSFFALLESHGIHARADFERYILRGEQILLPPDLFGPTFELFTEEVTVFQPGLDVIATRKKKIATEVSMYGPAWNAGVREGMRVDELETNHRPTQPITLRFEDGGTTQKIEYLPSETVIRTQYRPIAR